MHDERHVALRKLAVDVGRRDVRDVLPTIEAGVEERVGVVPDQQRVAHIRLLSGGHVGRPSGRPLRPEDELGQAHVVGLAVLGRADVRVELAAEPLQEGVPDVVDRVAIDVLEQVHAQLVREGVPLVTPVVAASDGSGRVEVHLLLELVNPVGPLRKRIQLHQEDGFVVAAGKEVPHDEAEHGVRPAHPIGVRLVSGVVDILRGCQVRSEDVHGPEARVPRR
mmetsp:Transcript_85095/g.190195  ORF Transcript_85095/g.190195 Transcript_85095/m.190195 type:complete len:222 (+) Transcript_85095:2482-3147(+)